MLQKQWMDLIIVLIRRMKMVVVSKFGGSTFLPATYIFFNTLLSVLNPHIERTVRRKFWKIDASSPFLCDFALEYVFWNVKKKRDKLKLNGIYQLLAYAGDGKLVGQRIAIRNNKKKIQKHN